MGNYHLIFSQGGSQAGERLIRSCRLCFKVSAIALPQKCISSECYYYSFHDNPGKDYIARKYLTMNPRLNKSGSNVKIQCSKAKSLSESLIL